MPQLRNAVLAVAAVCALAAPSFAVRYEIDPSHSSVGFKVRHLVISKTAGKFNDFSGWFEFDPEDKKAKGWKTEAVIQIASVDTANEKRDAHLRSADFFDAENHPTMTFASTGVKKTGDGYELTGDLTMRGKTKRVTLDLELHGVIDAWGKKRAGFTAQGRINRQDFGVSFSKTMETGGLVVDNRVDIVLEIEGIEADPQE